MTPLPILREWLSAFNYRIKLDLTVGLHRPAIWIDADWLLKHLNGYIERMH